MSEQEVEEQLASQLERVARHEQLIRQHYLELALRNPTSIPN